MVPRHVSGSPTIYQPSFLVVGDRTYKSGDENDLILLLFSYVGFLCFLVLRFFIFLSCRCMESSLSFPTETIPSIVSRLIAVVAYGLRHVKFWLALEVAFSFILLTREPLSFSLICICSERKVLLLGGPILFHILLSSCKQS